MSVRGGDDVCRFSFLRSTPGNIAIIKAQQAHPVPVIALLLLSFVSIFDEIFAPLP
jgi:hypothetical protein